MRRSSSVGILTSLGLATGEAKDKRLRVITVGVALLHGLCILPAVRRALFAPEKWHGPTDFGVHAWLTQFVFHQPLAPTVPHFGTHGLARLIDALLGITDHRFGMLFVTVGAAAAYGALLFRYFLANAPVASGPTTTLAAGASLAVALAESPAVLAGWSSNLPPEIFIPLNVPHSPTSLASRLPSLVLLLVVSNVLRGRSEHRVLLPAATVAAMLVKPSLAPLLAVVALAFAVWNRRSASWPALVRRLLMGLVLPMLAIGVLQWFIQRYQAPAPTGVRIAGEIPDPAGVRSIIFAPLHDLRGIGADRVRFWVVVAFPLAAYLLYGRRLRSTETDVAAGCTVLGFLVIALLRVEGAPYYLADLFHFFQLPLLLLTVAIVAKLMALGRPTRTDAARLAVLALVAVPYVLGGVAMWICQGGGPCLAP